MLSPVKLIDVELNEPAADILGLDGYVHLRALVRLHGAPIGYVELPVTGDRCAAATLRRAILEKHNWSIMHHLLSDLVALPFSPGKLSVASLVDVPHPVVDGELPTVTVAVCTRDRSDDLRICLDAIQRLEYPALDLLVVDNAPSDASTERLIQTAFPRVRYVQEPRPGLNWARNRAILEARGEIIAYTDDDVMVDPNWVNALVRVFIGDPKAMAVTGLVVPYELETEAQALFESYGGFGRGFKRRWHRLHQEKHHRWANLGTGQLGTGANMAYRLSLFEQVMGFDPALDVGTVTNGGGDLEMFYRVLKSGHTLVYEPDAMVRHRHRRDYTQLRSQITNNGVGLASFWVRSAMAYPGEWKAAVRMWLWWLWRWHLRRLAISLVQPARFPRELILAELKGFFVGLTRYQKARRVAARLADHWGPVDQSLTPQNPFPSKTASVPQDSIAVRTVELAGPVRALTDVTKYGRARIFVTWHDSPVGAVDIANDGEPIGAARLREAIVDNLSLRILDPNGRSSSGELWNEVMQALAQRYAPSEVQPEPGSPQGLPADVPVSIVVATLDRPDDLRECLLCLVGQDSPRPVEIIVVDNHPESGLTPPVVAEFPGVILVKESRRGLAYARNAGFSASSGDIAIATDDDVRMASGWLENLVAPFSRDEVMIVTGNVLPIELDTSAQWRFEEYGGLGRGFEPSAMGRDWFRSFRRRAVPTWKLGATANAAFRTTIFSHPEIGLMDEALGPGMPSGVGEDTYLFYKVLKAGYTLAYEPRACVWHKHRRTQAALHRQIYFYSKGHVAYHLTTLLQDQDLRALPHLLFHLPRWRIQQIGRQFKRSLRRKNSDYTWSLIWLEIAGNLLGPLALWQSHRRVKREGRSQPYVPVSQRATIQPQAPVAPQPHYPAVEIPRRTNAGIS